MESLGGLLGAISVFNLSATAFRIGLAPVISQIVETYRTIVHVNIIGTLFGWLPFRIPPFVSDLMVLYAVMAGIAVRTRLAHDKIYAEFSEFYDTVRPGSSESETDSNSPLNVSFAAGVLASLSHLIRVLSIALLWPLIVQQTLFYDQWSRNFERRVSRMARELDYDDAGAGSARRRIDRVRSLFRPERRPTLQFRSVGLTRSREPAGDIIRREGDDAAARLRTVTRRLKLSLLYQTAIVLGGLILLILTNAGLTAAQ